MSVRFILRIGLLCALVALCACAGPKQKRPSTRPSVGTVQVGYASYYADRFHGRRTASGERYHVRRLTAAHRSLPFGTLVRVRRLKTGHTVKVRINDRGPFVNGRIIDLSKAAAKKLDMERAGIAKVELTVLKTP